MILGFISSEEMLKRRFLDTANYFTVYLKYLFIVFNHRLILRILILIIILIIFGYMCRICPMQAAHIDKLTSSLKMAKSCDRNMEQ
jgi:hypothetical protein